MVYCTKCGTENKDDAENCLNCGASLTHPHPTMASPAYRPVRRDRSRENDICFGGRSNTTWPLIIGAFIILIGVSSLLEDTYSWARFDNLWPLLIIGIGLLIIYNALQRS